jgi:UDP-2-acetamido-3-amino-2,3-dideoxy-glucuronate N-acetyltransferase
MVGVPAKQVGWMSEFGEQLDLPLSGSAQTICPNTGDEYFLDLNVVTKKSTFSTSNSET